MRVRAPSPFNIIPRPISCLGGCREWRRTLRVVAGEGPRDGDCVDSAKVVSRLAERLCSTQGRAVFLTGAGISVASGIATYRGDGGVWANFVTEWGTRATFSRDPLAWYNEFWLASHGQAVTAVREAGARQGRHAILQNVGEAVGQGRRGAEVVLSPRPNAAHRAIDAIVSAKGTVY